MKTLHIFTIPGTAVFFDRQFAHLTGQGHEIHMIACDGNTGEFCRRNNVKFFPVEIPRRIDIAADIRAIRQIKAIILREKYAAVFGHTPKGALLAMVSAYLTRIPIRVYYRHGFIYTTATGVKRFIFKWVERITSLLSTKVVNVSPSIGDIAVRDKLNTAGKQCVIGAGTCGGIDAQYLFNPDCLEIQRRELRDSLGISPNDLVIGFCGRICKEKGIRELVDGFQLFRQQQPEVRAKLLLIGNLDHRDVLEQKYVDTIHNDPDIICVGTIKHDRVPAYYHVMDIFVLPSYREGFGMCVIEASAMEVPVLVSRSHGCIDSIREDVSGRYIDITPQGIAAGISALTDSGLRKRLGTCGRQFVLDNFDWSVMWPLIDRLYKDLQK